MGFHKAQRKQAKLRLALSGTSGSGKTMGALLIAKGLGGPVAVVDTERGSASLYSDIMDFDVMEMEPPYSPEAYIAAIKEAEKAGYNVLILDSISHEWSGQGGVLEIVDAKARSMRNPNSYAAWNEGSPRHQKFIDSMLGSSLHIIATMRAKSAYLEGEKNGKKTIQKVGSQAVQRDNIEFEFTSVLDLSIDGNLAVASKDRTRLFIDPFIITEQTGRDLAEWLNTGEKTAPAAAPQRAPAMPTAEELKEFCVRLSNKYGDDKTTIFQNLSSFTGREIRSTKELTREEISEFSDTILRDEEAA